MFVRGLYLSSLEYSNGVHLLVIIVVSISVNRPGVLLCFSFFFFYFAAWMFDALVSKSINLVLFLSNRWRLGQYSNRDCI